VLLVLIRMLRYGLAGRYSLKGVIASILYFSISMYGIVFLAGSRDGTIVTLGAITLVLLYWVLRQPVRRRIWVAIIVLAVFVSLAYALYTSPLTRRLVPLASYLQGQTVVDTSLLERSQMLSDGIGLWLQRPFFGWGVDQYRVVSSWGTYAHNNYVELLVDGGLIGLLLYLVVYVSAFFSLVRSWRLSRDPRVTADVFWGITALAALAAFDLAGVSYYDKVNWLMLSLLIALATRRAAEMRELLPQAVRRQRGYTGTC